MIICNLRTLADTFVKNLDLIIDINCVFAFKHTRHVLESIFGDSYRNRRLYDLLNVWAGLGVITYEKYGYTWFGHVGAHEVLKKHTVPSRIPKGGYNSLVNISRVVGIYCFKKSNQITITDLKKICQNKRRIFDVMSVLEGTKLIYRSRKSPQYKQKIVWKPINVYY
jgi:hypothetical protein